MYNEPLYNSLMTTKELTAFRIDAPLLQSLRFIKERDRVGISDQVRSAIETYVADRHATIREMHGVFDSLEDAMTSASNQGEPGMTRVPKTLGPVLGNRLLSSLTEEDMQLLERLAAVVGRRNKAHRDFWRRAREAHQKRTHQQGQTGKGKS